MTVSGETAAVTDVINGQLTLDLELLDRTGGAATSPAAAPASNVDTRPSWTTEQDTA